MIYTRGYTGKDMKKKLFGRGLVIFLLYNKIGKNNLYRN